MGARKKIDAAKWVRLRMLFVVSLFAVGLSAVVGRVYYLQTAKQGDLTQMSTDQTTRKVEVEAKRGSILDRQGTELAVTVEVPSIFARPNRMTNPRLVARQLAPHLGVGFEELVEKLERDTGFVWLERQAKPRSADAIRELGVEHVGITTESKRYYPLQERAGQLLGFVGIDGEGLEGLERAFDETMSGGAFELSGMRDARGRTLLMSDLPRFREFEGNSIVLTLDERVQRVAEESLKEQVEKFSAKGGYAVAVDVKTGEVLAMANTPSFDPNRFGEFGSKDWRMRMVTDTFEPGSVIKPFVLAAALEEGTITLQTSFDTEKGRLRIGRHTIGDSHPHELLTAAQIIQVSSNIGAYKIAQTIGREKLYRALKDFGFGGRTGLGLRGEQPGLVWPPDRWAEVSFANIAFGQGFTSTPLQTVMALAAVANGGVLMKPRLLMEIRDKDGGLVERTRPTMVRRVVSEEVARETAWAMSLVTLEEGTGTRAAMEHHTVAGKTGTAQKVNPKTRRYDPGMWVGSFVGFVPAERPEVAIAVLIDEPQEMHYGGVVAAPTFTRIAQEVLSTRGVMPLPREERFDLGVEEPEDVVSRSGGAGRPKAEKGVMMVPAMRVLSSEGGEAAEGEMPDFRGMTLKQALAQVEEIGLLPKVEGWGTVVGQEPPPGSDLAYADELALVLSPATRQALIAREPSTGVGAGMR